jgi:hypothetical protein
MAENQKIEKNIAEVKKMESLNDKTIKFDLSYSTFAAVFLVALFLLSAFQTLQLSEVSVELAGQKTALAGLKENIVSAAPALPPASSATIPDSLQNLPDMVGGC